MSESGAAFTEKMRALAAYARNPALAPMPSGLAPQRVRLYRTLYLNNLNELLANTLNLTHGHTPPSVWQHWVESFFDQYPHSTPYFMEIAGEFVQFLASDRVRAPDESDYLHELAHFEWACLAVSVDVTADPEPAFVAAAACASSAVAVSWLDGVPVMLGATAVLVYSHPVHEIENIRHPQTTFLLIYRDADDHPQCVALAPLAAQLLDAIKQNQQTTGRELIRQLAEATAQPLTAAFTETALNCMNDMRLRGILLGYRCKNETS